MPTPMVHKDSEMATRSRPSSATLKQWSDTIIASERLCLLGAKTIMDSAYKSKNGHYGFMPSISKDLVTLFDRNYHPTTSAQCVSALQALAPVIRRFRKVSNESSELPFHSLDLTKAGELKPKKLYKRITNAIKDAQDPLANDVDSDTELPIGLISKEGFEHLHPFVCAQVLKAISPGSLANGDSWWRALFTIAWFFNRAVSRESAQAGTSSSDCPETAYLTSTCINAVETAIQIWIRRRDRVKHLAELAREIQKAENKEENVKKLLKPKGISTKQVKDSYQQSIEHRKRILSMDFIECLDEFNWDSALPSMFSTWRKSLAADNTETQIKSLSFKNIEDKFEESIRAPGIIEMLQNKEENIETTVENIIQENTFLSKNIYTIVRETPRKNDGTLNKTKMVANRRMREGPDPYLEEEWGKLPSWVRNPYYWEPTVLFLQRDAAAPGDLDSHKLLQYYWHDLVDAAELAEEVINECKEFVCGVFRNYRDCAEVGLTRKKSPIKTLEETTSELDSIIRRLKDCIAPAIHRSEFLLNQQLANFRVGAHGRFDAGELVNALRTVCRYGDAQDFETVLSALEALCASQRPDGTWACSRPFIWSRTGFAGYIQSVDTARTLVSIVQTITRHPDRFGVGAEEALMRLEPTYECIYRCFQWLNGSLETFPMPKALRDSAIFTESEDEGIERRYVFGWCSDRAPEPGVIHTWVTAKAVEFLVGYRDLLQQKTNNALRARFNSYNPADLHTMKMVDPTDLNEEIEDRQIVKVRNIIRPHKMLDKAETSEYFPGLPEVGDRTHYSLILYGPPGTSKTHLAKAIAGELGWPLIMLSPSDFLAGGDAAVESRAREIFDALNCGSRLVYFFDEIDELVLDRGIQKTKERSVFSFVTPSFLTKLQDLRDIAKVQEFVFIIGTNYYDRIDSAARRAGRFDESFLLVYPDRGSRTKIVIDNLYEWLTEDVKNSGKAPDTITVETLTLHLKEKIAAGLLEGIINNTAMLSYPRLTFLCNKFWEKNDVYDLKKIREGDHPSCKWEITFRDYYERHKNLEELGALINLHDLERREKELNDFVKYLRNEAELGEQVKSKLVDSLSKIVDAQPTESQNPKKWKILDK